MSEKQTEKAVEKEVEKVMEKKPGKVDVKAFLARRLAVLNKKGGAAAERAAARLIENSRGGAK